MIGGEIKVVMTLDDNDFSIKTTKNGQLLSDLRRNIETTNDTVRSMESRFKSLGGNFRDTIFTLSLLRFAFADLNDVFLAFPKAVIKTSGEIERLTKLMQGLSSESDELKRKAEAAANVRFVFNLAQNAPFEVKALTDAFVKLKTAGLDPTDGKLQALTNSIAKFGGTTDVMHRASIAIQQMAGKGVISMEELRQQLGEAMPNAMSLMAQGLGLSIADLSKKVGKGVVDAQQGLTKMLFQAEMQNAGYAKDMMDTWTGQIEKLKTKWEMFKVEVGKSGGFENARAELKKILDAFDTKAAESWANKLGNIIAQLIELFGKAAKFIAEYADEIGAAVTAMLVTKFASLIAPFRTGMDGMMAAFMEARAASRDQLIQEQEDAKRLSAIKANELRARVASNEQAIVSLNKAKAEQHLANVKELESEIQHSQSLIALHRTRYDEMAALQEQFLMQTMAKEVEAEAMMRQKKAGTAALAREMQAEADRFRNNANVVGSAAATHEAEIEAIQKSITAKQQAIDVQKRYAREVDTSTFTIHGQNAALLKQAEAAEIAAMAQNRVAASAGLMNGVMGALGFGIRAVWESIKGFTMSVVAMGVQFAAVTFAVEAVIGIWNKIGEAARKSAERVRDAHKAIEDLKRGIADDASVTKIEADLAIKQARLTTLLMQGGTDREIEFDGQKRKRSEWIATLRKEVGEMETQLSTAKQVAQRNNVARLIDGIKAEVENVKDDVGSAFRQRYLQITQAENEAMQQAGNDQKKQAEVIKKYNAERDRINREQIESEKSAITRLMSAKQETLEQARKGQLKMTDDERKALEMGIVEMDKMRRDLDAKYQAGKIGFTQTLGNTKGEKRDRDPLAELLLAQEGQLAAARVKLEATIQGVRDVDTLRQEVALEMLGKIAKGDFGRTIHDENGKVSHIPIANKAQAGKYVAELEEYLKKGNTDIDAFINNLQGLDAKAKEAIKTVIQQAAEIKNLGQEQKVVEDMRTKAAAANVELNASMERLAQDGYAKVDTAILTLQKNLDKEEAKYTSVTQKLEAYKRARMDLMASTIQTSSNNWLLDESEKLRKAQDTAFNFNATKEQQAQRLHDREMDRINAEFNLRMKVLNDEYNASKKTKEDEDKFNAAQLAATNARAKAVERVSLETQNGSKTELEQLAANWKKTTDQINHLTASWASTFIDNLAAATTGGQAQWRKMLADMAMQVYKVFLQKQFADPLAEALGSIGKRLITRIENPVGKAVDSAAESAAGNAVSESMKNLKSATNEAGQAINDLSDNSLVRWAQQLWQGIKNMLFGETVEQTKNATTVTTTTALGSLTAAASAAATALAAVAVSGGVKSFGSFGGGAGGTPVNGDAGISSIPMDVAASGGISGPSSLVPIMGKGMLSMKAYAKGGIANSPQISLFGEAGPEAYVPLPDGRTIPVTMKGTKGGGDTNVTISIVVQGDGNGKVTASGDNPESWKEMANKVRDVVRGELVNQQRPGGLLAK